MQIVQRLPYRSPVSIHFQSLHWLNIEQRMHHKLLTTVFKCLCNKAPVQLAAKIVLRSPEDMILQTTFHPRSAAGKKSFSYLGPRCWNSLSRDLRILTDTEQFKGYVKHHLFTHFNEYKHSIDPYTTTVVSWFFWWFVYYDMDLTFHESKFQLPTGCHCRLVQVVVSVLTSLSYSERVTVSSC